MTDESFRLGAVADGLAREARGIGGASLDYGAWDDRRLQVYLTWKRVLDLFIIALTFPIWGVLMLVIATAIALESPRGHVMYVQERTGRNGRRFHMHKFRTMVPDAEKMKMQLLHLNERKWPEFKMTNDPRVTRVGRVLRPLHLDELPQIWDVIRGEMSLVGPRPTSASPDIIDHRYHARLAVPPGITGPWQITQRCETTFDEHMSLDCRYVERMSTLYDLWLLAKTGLMLTFGRFKC